VKKDEHIDAVLKSAYKTPQWGLAGAFSSAGTARPRGASRATMRPWEGRGLRAEHSSR